MQGDAGECLVPISIVGGRLDVGLGRRLRFHFQKLCVFRLMVDRISRSTWTLIPAQGGQNSGVIVDSFRGKPQ
jgi:hypothetical protein